MHAEHLRETLAQEHDSGLTAQLNSRCTLPPTSAAALADPQEHGKQPHGAGHCLPRRPMLGPSCRRRCRAQLQTSGLAQAWTRGEGAAQVNTACAAERSHCSSSPAGPTAWPWGTHVLSHTTLQLLPRLTTGLNLPVFTSTKLGQLNHLTRQHQLCQQCPSPFLFQPVSWCLTLGRGSCSQTSPEPG